MYKNNRIAVVVPAYNVENLIGKVILTMPKFIDKIVIVDDASIDDTNRIARQYLSKDKRIILIQHQKNQGVGSAIASGYKWSKKNNIDIAVVMAGDAQMHPLDLPLLLNPIIAGKADFTKGNRLFTGNAWHKIPKIRYLGNSILSLLTKIASGYWHIADSQCGYTALNKKILHTINWDNMYKRYGQPNDLLVRLNIENFTVIDVPVRPIYNLGEKSGIKPIRIIPNLSVLIGRLFLYRMWEKYVIRDFHPLVLFYFSGFSLKVINFIFLIRFFIRWIKNGEVPEITLLILIFCTFTSVLFFIFAMLFDMEYSRHSLYKL